ncbi:MAG: thioesterase [Pseudomonadota bacterium]|nr:thioesterase [Pseudomonadota bacterium]
MCKYSQKYIITNDCMDINYRLKPIEILMYFQDCFARYLTSKHIGAFDILKDDLYWIISEINIQVLQQLPFWSEEIEVKLWVSEVTKLKIFTDFELKYNGEIFAKGNCCWFLLNGKAKRPVATDVMADKMPLCSELVLGEHKKFTLENTADVVSSVSHKMTLSDIDFNNHVNNKSYIQLAEMTIPHEFRTNHVLKSLSVKYCKESYLGDDLICTTYKTDKDGTYVNKINKDGLNVCEINTTWQEVASQNCINDFPLKIRAA